MAMTQNHPQHHIPLRKDTEQVPAFNDSHSPHGMLRHDFHGFQHGCLGLDDGRGNTGDSEETHARPPGKRDLEAKLGSFQFTLES
jgi:hypothetical protein